MNSKLLLLSLILLSLWSCQPKETTPNILLIIADDWSYPHASFYGDAVVKTPHFDRIAKEGLVFDHAYVSSPSCTPSRAALLTGQHFWRLQEGASLYGPLRKSFPTYPDILKEVAYDIGFTDKGWGPGDAVGRPHNPAGVHFDSFDEFLKARDADTPFCFWYGSHNPHRGYKKLSGIKAGLKIDKIELPQCYPDSEDIRSDVADYYKEVQDFDNQIGEAITALEKTGELDNTIIIITSDNGMPFPRAKSNLYDWGTRVPLAIRWGNQIKEPKRIKDFVSLTDLAPTILDVTNQAIPNEMTGNSLKPFIFPNQTFPDQKRNQIFVGKERHVPSQEAGDWGGYPMRAIRTKDYLYIKNFKPNAWPAGTPNYEKATMFPCYYGDVDGGPTRTYMVANQDKDAVHKNLFNIAFAKRPSEELYDLNVDPEQLNNLAADENFTKVKKELASQLMEELKRTEDPRVVGGDEIFTSYPYTGGAPKPDNYDQIAAQLPKDNRPNVIVIMADDLGYETVGANGGTSYQTPQIDAMAANGMRFEHCYAQPLCTPSRVQIMTGIYNVRNYVRFGLLDEGQTTFGHLFQQAGYGTCIVGKWQLGKDPMSPRRAGFDEHCLWQVSGGRVDSTGRDTRFSAPILETNGIVNTYDTTAYGPEIVSEYGMQFMARSVRRKKPFLLYYPMILTHCPFSPTPDSPEWSSDYETVMEYKGKAPYFEDMMSYTDRIIGNINRKLEQLGIKENTLVIFTGDNGTDTPIVSMMNGKGVAGAKGQSIDGGTRVPLVVQWPKQIPSGQVNQDLIDFSDVLPTICEAANISVPNALDLDGKSFLAQLKNENATPRKWIYNWYSRSGEVEKAKVFARNQRYKLYDSGEFYEVPNDYLEEKPLDFNQLDEEAKEIHEMLSGVLEKYKGRRLEDVK